MSNLKLVIGCLLAIFGSSVFGEEVKIVKMGKQVLVVNIDRHPEKDLKYSKCVSTFKTERGEWTTTAVAVENDRICPAPESLVFDVTEKRTMSDKGSTETVDAEVPMEAFEKTYAYKGKDWKLVTHPRKITVKIKSSANSGMIEDSFYAAWVWDEISSEKMLLACDKAGSITEIFESMIKGDKPLAVGKVDGNVAHAATQPAHN